MTPTESQIREALDGKFLAYHPGSGRFFKMEVPPGFNPFSREGEKLIQKYAYERRPSEK